MSNYTVVVTITERYELEGVLNEDDALQIAEDCVFDNFSSRLSDNAIVSYNTIRTDIPQFGDATDAGVAGLVICACALASRLWFMLNMELAGKASFLGFLSCGCVWTQRFMKQRELFLLQHLCPPRRQLLWRIC